IILSLLYCFHFNPIICLLFCKPISGQVIVKGLTRLTGLTDLEQSGETIHAWQMVVKQEYSTILTHKIEQAAVGSVNLVKGLTRLTGLTAAAVCPSARPST
ncbi:MAG: hypothetical protein IJS19_07030, partial [Muribaculaceae bacterium]|nr:hypothetical protein [Muribaculaceae bacterium]